MDWDSFLQFFNEEKEDFYNLMNIILNSLWLFNYNILDDFKGLEIIEKNNDIKGENNEEDHKKFYISSIDDESSEDSAYINNTNKIKILIKKI